MRVVTFGEVMLRLAPPEFLRLRQTLPGTLEATYGGGEVNVAVSVAFQGGQSAFLTALPDNPLTDAFVQELRKFNVGADLVQRSKQGRFGIYFVETGANQRGSTVTYDRDQSSISLAGPEAYNWDVAFRDANWLHITGITPALSAAAAQSALAAVREAKQRKMTVSCDLNFRKKLWRWQPGTSPTDLARATMRELVPFVDLVIANEEDADLALGIKAAGADVEAGHIDIGGYEQVAKRIVEQFPNVSRVAITLRESISASHNNWGALLYEARDQKTHLAPLDGQGRYTPYEIHSIVDRVGAGDSFAGGLIFALLTPELSAPHTALRYAVAASCLKHSIKGDFSYAARDEIEALMKGSGSGRVQR
ncbi:MAG TPA: sugar kinase [Planctomycetaceae bacterium]|nr:sugar kinase [Planctomycetaceae bacterium]